MSSFRNLRAGSQVFALLMLLLCVILHAMWSGKSLQLPCILPFVVLVCHQYDVCKNYVGSVHVGGYGGLSKMVLRELCPVSFLVGEILSVCWNL